MGDYERWDGWLWGIMRDVMGDYEGYCGCLWGIVGHYGGL